MTFAGSNETQMAMRAMFGLVHLKSVVEAMPHACAVLDERARIVAASQAFCLLLRLNLEQIVGHPLGTEGDEWLIPPGAAEILGRLDALPPTGWDGAITIERSSRDVRKFLLSVREIVTPADSPRLFVFSVEDVTGQHGDSAILRGNEADVSGSDQREFARSARATARELREYVRELALLRRLLGKRGQRIDERRLTGVLNSLAESVLEDISLGVKEFHDTARPAADPERQTISTTEPPTGTGTAADDNAAAPSGSAQQYDAQAWQRAIERLTPRERAVLQWVVTGRSNKEVALLLDISPRTVEHHRAAAMLKMGARSVCDAVRMWTASGAADTERPSDGGQTDR